MKENLKLREAVESRRLRLSNGKYTIVDSDLYEELKKYRWCVDQNGYPMRAGKRKRTDKFINIKLHRVVNQTPKGMHTDHINRNILDNRRCNLRTVVHGHNMRNANPHKVSTSKYKGVGWHVKSNSWRARIQVNGKRILIGYYKNQADAALAYNAKAKELHGEYAYLNEVPNV